MQELGSYIAALRDKKGWTQRELARRMKFSSTAIQKIENGERDPKISTLIALAQALNVSELALLAAYKGKNPDEVGMENPIQNSQATLQEIIQVLMKNVPQQVFAEALLAVDGPEKVQELLAEAKRRRENR